MTISRLELTNFTVFDKASFEFCPGINVLIGENGTGKSHVLKAMYSMLSPWIPNRRQKADEADLEQRLEQVFRPEDFRSLVHRRLRGDFGITLIDALDRKAELHLSLEPDGRSWTSMPSQTGIEKGRCVFVPPREVLAMYRGFIAAYEGRELDFDATYYDLCKALSAAPLRGERAEKAQAMLAPLEQILGGRWSSRAIGFW